MVQQHMTYSLHPLIQYLRDKSDSNNYRGSALISAIAKVYDLILIQRYQVNLKTSDLQFAYKADSQL